MVVKLCITELYPVFDVETDLQAYGQVQVEVPDALVARYRASVKEFSQVQDEIEKIYETHRASRSAKTEG